MAIKSNTKRKTYGIETDICLIVPWHNPKQLKKFKSAWCIDSVPNFIYLVQDEKKEGCAKTKNRGIEMAIRDGREYAIILDDDCFNTIDMVHEDRLMTFMRYHEEGLRPRKMELFEIVSYPQSRGTPHYRENLFVDVPVAACMGYWQEIGDFDAVSQLVKGDSSLEMRNFNTGPMYGKYFPLCGMNISFPLSEYPYCKFIEVERFDDIWQGFVWQKNAYIHGKCFNLGGPMIRHSRQSNVWKNLVAEAPNMEVNETLWKDIFKMPTHSSYQDYMNLIYGKAN